MTDNIGEIRYLVELKRKDPEEYNVFLQELKEVSKDLMKMAMEITEELDNE